MKNIGVQYDEKKVHFLLEDGEETIVFSISYKEAKILNIKIKEALEYNKKMNIKTCSVCQGKKQIKSGGRWKETVVCPACGGRGFMEGGLGENL